MGESGRLEETEKALNIRVSEHSLSPRPEHPHIPENKN